MLYLFYAGFFGLLMGSFLNVVILRLPILLKNRWQKESQAFLSLPLTESPIAPFNLMLPKSHCLHCKKAILIRDNIPLCSYFLLRGRCRYCQNTISWQYPLVEMLSAVLSLLVVAKFGVNLSALFALFLTFSLITLSFIDIQQGLLPDNITIPSLWLGLSINLFGIFQSESAALIGAMAGYLFLWSIYWIFKILTGKEGMGFGDFKLLAMLGAWLGWQALPIVILIASLSGTLFGLGAIIIKNKDKNSPMPFGPFLAFGGYIALLYAQELTAFYFRYML
jgi:leader peptidase (prepilin peptidase)/N-methyltransferase